jgi:hypothetical protein
VSQHTPRIGPAAGKARSRRLLGERREDGPGGGNPEGGEHAARGQQVPVAARGRRRRGCAAVGGAREAPHPRPRPPRHRPDRSRR